MRWSGLSSQTYGKRRILTESVGKMQIQLGDVLANLIAIALIVGVIIYVIRGFWKRLDNLRNRDNPGSTEIPPKDQSTTPTAPTTLTSNQLKFRVFLSYRRADSPDVTGRIYDRLVATFGREAVFKDVDDIPLGVDFRSQVQTAISQTNVLLAIIGPRWRATSDDGKARLSTPGDHVRIEIAFALQQDTPLIPVLVSGASIPAEQELPEDIKPLIYRNAVQVRPDPDFHNDVDRLLKGITTLLDK